MTRSEGLHRVAMRRWALGAGFQDGMLMFIVHDSCSCISDLTGNGYFTAVLCNRNQNYLSKALTSFSLRQVALSCAWDLHTMVQSGCCRVPVPFSRKTYSPPSGRYSHPFTTVYYQRQRTIPSKFSRNSPSALSGAGWLCWSRDAGPRRNRNPRGFMASLCD